MKKKFGDWLSEQLRNRNMIPADLTEMTGLGSGVISNLINNKRAYPHVETCREIARALEIPLKEVYIAAGILDPEPEYDQITDRILNTLLDLPHEDKQDILAYVELRSKLAKERNTDNVSALAAKIAKRAAST